MFNIVIVAQLKVMWCWAEDGTPTCIHTTKALYIGRPPCPTLCSDHSLLVIQGGIIHYMMYRLHFILSCLDTFSAIHLPNLIYVLPRERARALAARKPSCKVGAENRLKELNMDASSSSPSSHSYSTGVHRLFVYPGIESSWWCTSKYLQQQ